MGNLVNVDPGEIIKKLIKLIFILFFRFRTHLNVMESSDWDGSVTWSGSTYAADNGRVVGFGICEGDAHAPHASSLARDVAEWRPLSRCGPRVGRFP